MSSCSLDHWRNVFRSTERSIFEVIEMLIAVAAADRPDELVRRRDGIVMSLYSSPSVVAAAANGRTEEADQQQQQQPAADATSYCCSSGGGGGSQKSSPEEAMADELQDALDDAFALLDDVLRLKKILDDENEEDESTSVFEALRSLQSMELTVSTLTATDIENSVRGVEGRHGSARVRQLARVLLSGWAELIRGDSLNITDAVADAPDTPTNSLDDPWANFPPLDEGALRAINGPPFDLDDLFSEIELQL